MDCYQLILKMMDSMMLKSKRQVRHIFKLFDLICVMLLHHFLSSVHRFKAMCLADMDCCF